MGATLFYGLFWKDRPQLADYDHLRDGEDILDAGWKVQEIKIPDTDTLLGLEIRVREFARRMGISDADTRPMGWFMESTFE